MSADPVKKLHAFIKRLPPLPDQRAADRPGSHTSDSVVLELMRSFFIWESGVRAGARSLAQLDAATADYNEVRVCLPHEVGRIVTQHDAKFEERVLRLRSVLNHVYRREHDLLLAHLLQQPKRDARAYLESLDGMPPFVSARVCVTALGAHGVPVDSRVISALVAEKALPSELETAPHAECASWLEHHIRADESASVHHRLEAHLDALADAPEQTGAPKRKPVKAKAAPRRARATPAPKKRSEA